MCKEEKVVLCGANAYDKKYYFNETFKGIPDSIKDELHIICVLFTEEVGGIFTIEFEKDGSVSMRTEYAEDDFLYDEVSSGLSALVLPCVTWPLRQLQLELHVVVAGHASHVDKGVAHASQCGVDAHIGGVGNLLE